MAFWLALGCGAWATDPAPVNQTLGRPTPAQDLPTPAAAEELQAENTIETEEEVEIHLQADQLEYNEETGQVTAKGKVQVDLEDAKIQADELKLDTKEDLLDVVGHVQLDVKGQSMDRPWQADSATYLIKDKTIEAQGLAAQVTDPQIKGQIYIKAKSGRDTKNQMAGQEGTLTTCDLDHPHYYFKAAEFTYLPHDKLIGKEVSFYALDKKIWTVPYYVFDLNQKKASRPLPTFGSSQVEGFFAKGAFDYVIDQQNTGLLLVDVMQKKGMGIGFDHSFVWSEKPENKAGLAVYYLREKDTALDDWVIKLSHKQNIWPELTTDLKYRSTNTYRLTGGRQDDKEAGLSASWRPAGTNNNLRLLWQKSATSSWAYSQQAVFSHNSKLPFNLDLGLQTSWQRWPELGTPQQKADLDFLKVGSSWGWGNWQVNLKKRLIRPESAYTSWSEKWPELEVRTNYLPWWGIDWQLLGTAGAYEEHTYYGVFERVNRSSRYIVGGQAKKSFKAQGGERWDLGANFKQYNYSTGDAAYSEGQSLAWDSGLRKFFGPIVYFSDNLIWQRQNFYGGSPLFLTDKVASSAFVKNTFSLSDEEEKYRLRTSAGYDLKNHLPQDLMLEGRLAPDPVWKLTANTGYNLRQKFWNDLVVKADHNALGTDGKISLGARYSFVKAQLMSWDTSLEYSWGDRWQDRWTVKLTHSFQPYQGNMIKYLSLTKDLHCWEAEASYDNVAHVIMFRLGIKAFPGQGMEFKG